MKLDFSKLNGLLTAVIQDHKTGRVLMVGFMNQEAFDKTVETGSVTFYSRSRNKLWLKGETSGHRLVVKEISTDCDHDALLVKVERLAPGSVTKATRAVSFGAWRTASGRNPNRAPTIRPPSTGVSRETQTRHSQGQPRKRDHRSVPPRRIQHHHQLALVFPRDRRPRNRVHDDSRTGDGALHRRWCARRRSHRPRLDRGERGQSPTGGRLDLRQAEFRKSALGAGRTGGVAVPEHPGPGG